MNEADQERTRRAQIERIFMDPRQEQVFQLFVGLGEERSLPKLLEVCVAENIQVSGDQLKRWSSRFKWFDLAIRTDAEISRRLAEEMLPEHVKLAQRKLSAVMKLQDEFCTKVESGEITITNVREFVQLMKAEKLLLIDPAVDPPPTKHEHSGTVEHVVRLAGDMPPEQVMRLIRIGAATRHGLPAPAESEVIEGEAVNAQ